MIGTSPLREDTARVFVTTGQGGILELEIHWDEVLAPDSKEAER